tara:strand:- start:4830 stop:5231 length:402 start_codon:yes stop_codon:yes gene_type:complete
MLDVNLDINNIKNNLKEIVQKIIKQKRIDNKEALLLYKSAPNSLLFSLANSIREKLNGDYTYFNKNIHIEPTNICVFDCKFCSYSRLLKEKNEGWQHSMQEMVAMVEKYDENEITEVHIVGGVHPKNGSRLFY